MRKARSLARLFEWSAVHSDVARAVSLDLLSTDKVNILFAARLLSLRS